MTEASRHGYVTAAAEREVVSSDVVLLLGRVLMAAIFLNGGFHKLTGLEGFAGYLAGHGAPLAMSETRLRSVSRGRPSWITC